MCMLFGEAAPAAPANATEPAKCVVRNDMLLWLIPEAYGGIAPPPKGGIGRFLWLSPVAVLLIPRPPAKAASAASPTEPKWFAAVYAAALKSEGALWAAASNVAIAGTDVAAVADGNGYGNDAETTVECCSGPPTVWWSCCCCWVVSCGWVRTAAGCPAAAIAGGG